MYWTWSIWTCQFPFRSDGTSRCRPTRPPRAVRIVRTPQEPASPYGDTLRRPGTDNAPSPATADTVRPGHIGQRCQESGPDPGQHSPILPPATATPPRNTEHAQSQPWDILNLTPADRYATHRPTSSFRSRHDRRGLSTAACATRARHQRAGVQADPQWVAPRRLRPL